METLKRELPDTKKYFEVTLTKVNARGLRLAIVKLDEHRATKLVGWVRCRFCLSQGQWSYTAIETPKMS